MRFYSFFEDTENKNADKINEFFPVEVGNLILLFGVLNDYLDKVNGLIKTDDFPEHTILNLSAQNLQLINNSFILFTQGYLRTPAILLRAVSEQLILCMYFKEYPEKESDYRNLPYRDFFTENRIEKMLSKIDREGKIFRISTFKEYNFWNRTIFQNFYEELSSFVHSDTTLINNLMFDETNKKYHKGPKIQEREILMVMLGKIFQSLLYTILILDKTFEPKQENKEIEVIKKAVEILNSNLKPSRNIKAAA